MRDKLSLAVAFLGIGVSLQACRDKPPNKNPTLNKDPTLNEGTGGGTHTTNGVKPYAYWCLQGGLDERMKNQLVVGGAGSGSNVLAAPFAPLLGASSLEGNYGSRLVDDTVDCAVHGDFPRTPVDAGIPPDAGGLPPDAQDKGLLNSTTGWPNAGLDDNARLDLHACLATRLNPTGAEVPIWLEGDKVKSDGSTAEPFREALWIAIGRGAETTIHAWPSPELTADCGEQAVGTFMRTRICGQTPATCKFVSHPAPSMPPWAPPGCTEDPTSHHWTCTVNGITRPAILTKLGCDAFCALYPGCRRIPGCPADSAPCPTPTLTAPPCGP